MRRAFTLIELIVVIGIIAVLAALLFPVFARVRAHAKSGVCLSNLRQIGGAIGEYMADYDDVFPHAIDAADKVRPEIWTQYPEFQARIPSMPMLHEVLQPYIKNRPVFQCPCDTGMRVLDSNFPLEMRCDPTLFGMYGSSYFFRTEIAFKTFMHSSLELPADINVLFDGAGHWHGAGRRLEATDRIDEVVQLLRGYRYNVLFGDLHAESATHAQVLAAWNTKL